MPLGGKASEGLEKPTTFNSAMACPSITHKMESARTPVFIHNEIM
jgi:hypothetical protein